MEEDDNSVTMVDVLKEQEAFEENAKAVLGASDDKNCTYTMGYVKRQALYACLTCCPDSVDDPTCRSGLCLACSLACHENHTLIELYTKRNFRCDCGGPKFKSKPCTFSGKKSDINAQNQYNQNFSGLYCVCHRPYPDPEETIEDEMIQCIICEDWFHSRHLDTKLPPPDQYSEMICQTCMDKNDFLNDYLCYEVLNGKEIDQDTSIELNVSESVRDNEHTISAPSIVESLHSGDSLADSDNKDNSEEQNVREETTKIGDSVTAVSGPDTTAPLEKSENGKDDLKDQNEISEIPTDQTVLSESKIVSENNDITEGDEPAPVLNDNDNSKVEEPSSNISETDSHTEIKNPSSEVTLDEQVHESEMTGEKSLIVSHSKADEPMEVDNSSAVNNDDDKTHSEEVSENCEKSQEALGEDLYGEGMNSAQDISGLDDKLQCQLQNSGDAAMEVDEKSEPHQETESLEKCQQLHKQENESNESAIDIQTQKPAEDNINLDVEQDVDMEIGINKETNITVDNCSENITDDSVQKCANVMVIESEENAVIESEESAVEKSDDDVNEKCISIVQKEIITTEKDVDETVSGLIDDAPEKDTMIEKLTEIENLPEVYTDNSLEKLVDNASEKIEGATDGAVNNAIEKVENSSDEVVDDVTKKVENIIGEVVSSAVETAINEVVENATENVGNATDEVIDNATENVKSGTDETIDSATENVEIAINEIVDKATEKSVDNMTEENVDNVTETDVYNTPTKSVENVSKLNDNYIISETKIDIDNVVEPDNSTIDGTIEDVCNSTESTQDNTKDVNSVNERDVANEMITDNISEIENASDAVVDMDSKNASSCRNSGSKEQDSVSTNNHVDELNDNTNLKEPKDDTVTEIELESKEHDKINVSSDTTNSTIMNLEADDSKILVNTEELKKSDELTKESVETDESDRNQLTTEESIKADFDEHLKCDAKSELATPEESTKLDSKIVESMDLGSVENTSQRLANTEQTNGNSINNASLENNLVTPSEDTEVIDAAHGHSEESVERENNVINADKMEESLDQVPDVNLESKSKDLATDTGETIGVSSECAVQNASEQNSLPIKEIQTNSNVDPENVTTEETTPQIYTNETACDTFDNKKRKHDVDSSSSNSVLKKIKIKEEISLQVCIRPAACQKPKRRGAVFWPSDWRSKLCSCSCCLDIYNEKQVSFLLDLEDTVSAYEDLGKIKTEASSSQYEKGMEALSSLGHVQQINAITEYNKMKEKLLEFLKTFKDKKEVVKEEDIKGFFAGMKPKREPDGVYFCQ